MSRSAAPDYRKPVARQTMQSKRRLRQRLLGVRESLPEDVVTGWSRAIADRLTSMDRWHDVESLHCYIGALPGEARTAQMIERAWRAHKTVICPRVRPHGQLEHRQISDWSQLRRSAFGLLEPDPDLAPPINHEASEIILVPGLAFSLNGRRLGMGGGYYDRFLSDVDATRIGLAFELQLQDVIPQSDHDEPVDLIVTELRVIPCR